jgi:hypothetical protein
MGKNTGSNTSQNIWLKVFGAGASICNSLNLIERCAAVAAVVESTNIEPANGCR